MISIIVPVFNAEKFLARCIQSILEQTYEDFELILVDDGSTDSSRILCNKYAVKDRRVKAFHKLNGGANSARIMGLNNAIGEFVLFVDSDDCIHKETLEIFVNGIDENVDVVIANTNEDAIITGIEWAKKLLERKIRCEIWGSLYKRNMISEAFYCIPSDIVIGEDLLSNLYCSLKVNAVKLISSNAYMYTVDNPMSLVNTYKLSLEHERLFIDTVDNLLESSGVEELAFSMFMNKYFVLERLVFRGMNPYNESWVKNIMSQRFMFKSSLSFKENCLLSIPSSYICRHILKIGIYIKRVVRNRR